MRLLLVRHGPAADRLAWGARGKDDHLRPLTEEGRERTREAALGLARLVGAPDLVATSPFTRAGETTRIVLDALGAEAAGAGEPRVLAALAPDGDPAAILPWLARRPALDLVLVVGHEPHLGRLASLLLAGTDRVFLQLKKAGACLLDLGDGPRPGEARLLWLLAPSQLRRLGRAGRPAR